MTRPSRGSRTDRLDAQVEFNPSIYNYGSKVGEALGYSYAYEFTDHEYSLDDGITFGLRVKVGPLRVNLGVENGQIQVPISITEPGFGLLLSIPGYKLGGEASFGFDADRNVVVSTEYGHGEKGSETALTVRVPYPEIKSLDETIAEHMGIVGPMLAGWDEKGRSLEQTGQYPYPYNPRKRDSLDELLDRADQVLSQPPGSPTGNPGSSVTLFGFEANDPRNPYFNPFGAGEYGQTGTIGHHNDRDDSDRAYRNRDDSGNSTDSYKKSSGGSTDGGYKFDGKTYDDVWDAATSTGNKVTSGGEITTGGHSGNNSQSDPNDPRDWSTAWPIILDLDGVGIHVTELSESQVFVDANNDGLENRIAWAGVGNGVLFYDADGDGTISQTREFVFSEWDPTATSDLEAIASVFDTNGDGALDANDAAFADFKVMVTHEDGTFEVKTLTELGITAIDLTGDATHIELPDGSVITGQTDVRRIFACDNLPSRSFSHHIDKYPEIKSPLL